MFNDIEKLVYNNIVKVSLIVCYSTTVENMDHCNFHTPKFCQYLLYQNKARLTVVIGSVKTCIIQ